MNAGVPLWKDVIINYRFENRSQDFTYIALDNYLNKFGFENALDLFKKNPELEKLLFCESREISEKFLKLLIDFSTPKILNHYLSLIEKNTTDKMLRIHSGHDSYQLHSPTGACSGKNALLINIAGLEHHHTVLGWISLLNIFRRQLILSLNIIQIGHQTNEL